MLFDSLMFALVLIAIFLAGMIFWRENIFVPHVVETILPPYEIPELIVASGVLIENRGRAPARRLRIALEYPNGSVEKIRNLQIVSDAVCNVSSGGEQEAFLNLDVPQLDTGSSLVIYFSGSNKNQPRVTITFDQRK